MRTRRRWPPRPKQSRLFIEEERGSREAFCVAESERDKRVLKTKLTKRRRDR